MGVGEDIAAESRLREYKYWNVILLSYIHCDSKLRHSLYSVTPPADSQPPFASMTEQTHC